MQQLTLQFHFSEDTVSKQFELWIMLNQPSPEEAIKKAREMGATWITRSNEPITFDKKVM
jgi:hypothetical protein